MNISHFSVLNHGVGECDHFLRPFDMLASHGLLMGLSWDTHGMLMGCSWDALCVLLFISYSTLLLLYYISNYRTRDELEMN